MSHREYAFGTDFGGVITPGGRDDTSDTSFFSDNYLNTPHLDHSFETLAALSTIYGDDMYVVSKCGPKIQDRTRSWMEAHDFFETTGISEDHVVFCLERYQKAGICTELGIRAFVDDRADVLGYIDSSVTRYLFDSPYTSPDGARSMGLVPVATWEEIARLELA